MKNLSLLLLFFCISQSVFAEKRYVIDELRVPMRKTPCGRCTIVHGGIKSGTELTLIEQIRPKGEAEDWSHIQTRSGKTGWMPSQYLTSKQVAKVRIKGLEVKFSELQQQNQLLTQQLQAAADKHQQLLAETDNLSTSNTHIAQELNQIKEISGSAIALQNQNQELLKRNKMLQTERDVLSATNEQLRNKDSQTWFFYGGIAVVMGALLSILLPQLKRRKKFSEWG